ncbi:hypothetical protein V6N13_033763 [Hibiscus sabdariffa]|uniref:Uncharacterized protein n=1 Tax=Hibiscus sabdariffa TaxID=183260 RepID=A0ABR2F9M2_9ROSI
MDEVHTAAVRWWTLAAWWPLMGRRGWLGLIPKVAPLCLSRVVGRLMGDDQLKTCVAHPGTQKSRMSSINASLEGA